MAQVPRVTAATVEQRAAALTHSSEHHHREPMARISSNSEDQGCPDACPVARSNTCGPALDTSAARYGTRGNNRATPPPPIPGVTVSATCYQY